MKTASNEPGESEEAREPSVPGMSPARPLKERTTSGVSTSTQGPARPLNEVGGTRTEASPNAHRGEHGTRTHGHDANVVNRTRNVTDSRGPIQQGYTRPDNREGTQGRGEREMSWDTPECSSFHHHVSSRILCLFFNFGSVKVLFIVVRRVSSSLILFGPFWINGRSLA